MKAKLNLFLIIGFFLIGCTNMTNPSSNANDNDIVKENLITAQKQAQQLPISAFAIMGNQKIELEVTKTPEQQQLGLMYRESLEANRGMLFTFSPPREVGFWMKNVVIPLDMVFIFDGKIKTIKTNVPPCKVDPCPVYHSNALIDNVIELKGGKANELNLKVGDPVNIEFLDNPGEK